MNYSYNFLALNQNNDTSFFKDLSGRLSVFNSFSSWSYTINEP